LPAGRDPITGSVHVEGVEGGTVDLVVDGRHVRPDTKAGPLGQEAADIAFTLPPGSVRHWFRADVRRADGRLWLIGNPIYVR